MSTQLATVKNLITSDGVLDRIRSVAGRHFSPDRLARIAVVCFHRSPKLLDCSRESMVEAVMHCAELGLEPGGALGHIYLVPRGGKVVADIGYKGLAELARRSGKIARINAGVVYADELDSGTFEATHEPPSIKHSVSFNVDKHADSLRLAYCVVETLDGGRYQIVIDKHEVNKAFNSAMGTNRADSPWNAHADAMWRKTAIKRLLGGGLIPLSKELSRAIEIDAGPVEEAVVVEQPAARRWDEPRGEPAQIPETPAQPEVVEAAREPVKAAMKPKAKPRARGGKAMP